MRDRVGLLPGGMASSLPYAKERWAADTQSVEWNGSASKQRLGKPNDEINEDRTWKGSSFS